MEVGSQAMNAVKERGQREKAHSVNQKEFGVAGTWRIVRSKAGELSRGHSQRDLYEFTPRNLLQKLFFISSLNISGYISKRIGVCSFSFLT